MPSLNRPPPCAHHGDPHAIPDETDHGGRPARLRKIVNRPVHRPAAPAARRTRRGFREVAAARASIPRRFGTCWKRTFLPCSPCLRSSSGPPHGPDRNSGPEEAFARRRLGRQALGLRRTTRIPRAVDLFAAPIAPERTGAGRPSHRGEWTPRARSPPLLAGIPAGEVFARRHGAATRSPLFQFTLRVVLPVRFVARELIPVLFQLPPRNSRQPSPADAGTAERRLLDQLLSQAPGVAP